MSVPSCPLRILDSHNLYDIACSTVTCESTKTINIELGGEFVDSCFLGISIAFDCRQTNERAYVSNLAFAKDNL